MCDVLISLLAGLTSALRTRASLQVEILGLRHQLAVLRRSKPKQVVLRPTDRLLWVALSRLWPQWRRALMLVKPETVIRWHRKGFRLYWRWKSRERSGQPGVSKEIRDLIRNKSSANVLWGAPRLHPELLKPGIEVSQATVAKYMVKHRRPPSPTWRTFLENHVKKLVSVDFLVGTTGNTVPYAQLFAPMSVCTTAARSASARSGVRFLNIKLGADGSSAYPATACRTVSRVQPLA